MGFLTNISISNDFWHTIKDDPQKFIDAITIGMNSGAGSPGPLSETYDARETNGNLIRHNWEMKHLVAPQGVTVHQARHYDEPQVIVNARGTHAIAAHEIPYAIRSGWLDVREYNRQHAETVAKTLEDLAKDIRWELKSQGVRKGR